MTDEQINRAIAEACGWWGNRKENYMRPPNRTDVYCEIPNYCADLNAMHEAEEHLSGNQFNTYALMLDDISNLFGIRATARQRAEALLRTLGKFKE